MNSGDPEMKSIIEITRMDSGATERGPWVRLWGLGRGGKALPPAVAFGDKAAALKSELDAIVPEGEEIASRRLLVELIGDYREGKPIVRNGQPVMRDGQPVRSRSFYVEKFKILTGPTLELARIRRDGETLIDRAEALRTEGKLDEAYRTLLEFASRACNRPMEIVTAKADAPEDDEVFGEVQSIETPAEERNEQAAPTAVAAQAEGPAQTERDSASPEDEPNPEAAAAAAFAAEDAMTSRFSRAVASHGPSSPAERDVLDDDPPKPEPRASLARSPMLASRSIPQTGRSISQPAPQPARQVAGSSAEQAKPIIPGRLGRSPFRR